MTNLALSVGNDISLKSKQLIKPKKNNSDVKPSRMTVKTLGLKPKPPGQRSAKATAKSENPENVKRQR